jgi:hypothetical protein
MFIDLTQTLTDVMATPLVVIGIVFDDPSSVFSDLADVDDLIRRRVPDDHPRVRYVNEHPAALAGCDGGG